jgi:hypothetical protein
VVQPLAMLPPDDDQVRLAKEVNTKLGPDTKVTFFRSFSEADGMRFGVVYQYGSARRSFLSAVPHYDADDLVDRINNWVKRL